MRVIVAVAFAPAAWRVDRPPLGVLWRS